MFGEKRNSQILADLLVTNFPKCTNSNAKTFGFEQLQLPDMAAGGRHADGARVVHHWTMSCLYSRPPILIVRQHLLLSRGPSTPRLWTAFFLN